MSESIALRPPFELRLFPDPILARPCVAVELFGKPTQQLALDMFAAMEKNDGVGLAANQMGQSERLFVISGAILEDGLHLALFNPRLSQMESPASGAAEEMGEGCLSLPGVRYVVPSRSRAVTIDYLDAWGRPCSRRLEGLAALCAQHELDHLDGITMLDRLSPLKARRARERLAKQAKAGRKT